ncbi:MAG: ankyrin repeat domain-containing protein [Crocosphaera sp.]|nr:ankyrin repeat domain-containing protein [Crocosphaera sp.]
MIPSYRKDSLEEHYRQLHKLGEGGMGTTYAAEDVNTGKKVALKVISLHNQTDAKSLELLEREVRVLKQLNHANIPKYIDYFQLEDDNKLYLVQELVSGKNLNQKIEEGLRLIETEVKNIAKQVLSILDYLHNFDPCIIHRDIKPHNLILSDDGQIFDTGVALIEAVRQKHKDIVELLLDYGIDVNVQGQSRFTAIGSAILTGQKDLVQLLIERGADINTIDTTASLSGSMLHEAVYNAATKKETSNNHEDIATILLNLGLDVNSRDKEDSTPLHYAAVRGSYLYGREPYTSMIELLIANGADVNIRNIYGQTPLHLAVIWDGMGHRDSRFGDQKNAIEMLIANGANLNVRDKEGKTPLAHAKERGNRVIMELLKKHGAR